MTFISYAQNFEDVMLYRALKDIDNGFYIDVGANDPVMDSVTKAFYDEGWHGINIEPVSEWFEKLQEDRPNDVNLQLAVGARKGKLNFYEVIGTGLSTMNYSFAEHHKQERGYDIKNYKVPVFRLDTICEEYNPVDIHFLKIDVEGNEKAVLEGFNLKKFRPWIILVEATLPNSKIENFREWEFLLINKNYHYIYFDGLNRFYIADEHKDLVKFFNSPPNIFDDFKRANEYWYENHCHSLQKRLDDSKYRIAEIESEFALTKTNAIKLETLLHEKIEILTVSQAAFAELQNHNQWFQTEWDESKERIEQLASELAVAQTNVTHLETQLHEKSIMYADSQTALAEQQANNQWLQTEWDESKERIEQLASELAVAQTNVTHFETELHEKAVIASANQAIFDEQQAQIQLLKAERDEANENVNILNHSRKSWQLEAERINEELHSVYRSKSWRIMWPVRKLTQILKWLLLLPIHIIIWLVNLPKRIFRRFFKNMISYITSRPSLRLKLINRLNGYPRIKIKLKSLIFRHNLNEIHYKEIQEKNSMNSVTDTNNGLNKGTDDILSRDTLEITTCSTQMKNYDGINYKAKSPLEKWFC